VVWANERLYLGPAAAEAPVAVFTGRELDVEIAPLDPSGDHRVRATVRFEGFVLHGWLRGDAVDLRAAREVAVVGPHVTILRGAHLAVVTSPKGSPRIEAQYVDFAGLTAPATCDALTVETQRGAQGPVAPARYVHLRRDRARLLGAPGGATVVELRARRTQPTLRLLETRGGASRVVSMHAVRIAGWVPEEDLAPGEGPDCDDCYGPGIRDSWDRCPDVPEAGDGRDVDGCPDAYPPPTRIAAPRELPIRVSPQPDGVAIGIVEKGATVYVLDRRGAFARVRPREYVVTPAGGGDFWVELGADPTG
jgi:hypothetical protein